MKRMLKVSLSVVLTVLLLFSFPSTAFAYEYGTPDLKTMVKVQKHGNKESRFISGRDVNRIRISKSAKYKNKTDREKLKEIFEALEINIKDKQFEAVCQTLKLSDIEDIHTEVSYIKTDENGVQTGVSKTEALKVAEESHVTIPITEESAGARSLITHSNPVEHYADGCMEAQIIAIYTPNVNGNKTTVDRYMFLGVFDWLKTPVTRRTDAISLFSKDISWIDKGVEANSNYGLAVSYEKAVYDDNGLFISNEDIDVEFYENAADVTSEKGVYFTYNLPDNNPLAHTVYSSFSFLILGTGMVTNGTTTKYPSVDAEYIHITNPLSLPLNVSWGVVGLDVDALFTPKRYRTHHTWEYKLDYEA